MDGVQYQSRAYMYICLKNCSMSEEEDENEEGEDGGTEWIFNVWLF